MTEWWEVYDELEQAYATDLAGRACPEGFYWIGQPFESCDQCGLPYWRHDGMATTISQTIGGSDKFVLQRWTSREYKRVLELRDRDRRMQKEYRK